MARANRHYLPGNLIWHITHRCHKREFLLKFVRDRRTWLRWLFEAKKRYGLCVLNYMVTSNVLRSEKDGKFYTGFTSNLKLRFEQHNKGLVGSTRDRGPRRLIYYEACLDQNDATKREKYLKTYHGKMFLKKRLKSYLTG